MPEIFDMRGWFVLCLTFNPLVRNPLKAGNNCSRTNGMACLVQHCIAWPHYAAQHKNSLYHFPGNKGLLLSDFHLLLHLKRSLANILAIMMMTSKKPCRVDCSFYESSIQKFHYNKFLKIDGNYV